MKQSLGKGLQSLIPNKKQTITNLASSQIQRSGWAKSKKESIFNVETDKIRPNSLQPRRNFANDSLKELADSIREHGILQPILVTKVSKTTDRGQDVEYELIAGERRWRAAKIAKLPRIPVIIRDSSAKQKLEIALVENIQRENLNPIEKALAFKQFQDNFNLKHREIAQKVGRKRTTVTNYIRLLNLPKEIQNAMAVGKISEGHGRAILMAKPSVRLSIFKDVIKNGLSVRMAEEKARKLAVISKYTPCHGPKNIFFKRTEKEIADNWGRRVSITQRGETGHMNIEFVGNKELRKLRSYMLKM